MKRHARFGDAVIRARSFFKRQSKETGSIEPVNGWPTVQAVADGRRSAFLPRDRDEARNEAGTIAIAMNRWGKAHTGCAQAGRVHFQHSRF